MDLSTWGHEPNHPANEIEEVKSYTNEELFYSQENINDITINYVNDLEKKVRELKRQLKELL